VQMTSINSLQLLALSTTQFQVFSSRHTSFTDSQLNGLPQSQLDALYS
jgi:hypothetical protein